MPAIEATDVARDAGAPGVGRERWTHTSAGPIELPMQFDDTAVVAAFFPVPLAGVVPLVDTLGFVPVSLAGRGVVSLVYYDYRITVLGPYREVGLAVLARPAVRRTMPGWVVIDLPVTTTQAEVAGREIWGYPKFVGRIDHDQQPTSFSGALYDPDGGLICRLQGAPGRGVRIPSFTLATFTRLDDRVLRTDVRITARLRACRPGSVRADVGDSPHPMTGHLRALGIGGRRPLVVLSATGMRVVLPRGRVV